MKRVFSKIKWKKAIKWLIIIAVVVTAGGFAYKRFVAARFQKASTEEAATVVSVETRDIQNTLSSSGTISPLNSYEVTTLVEGEIIAADFEEGDTVEKGQVLYQIATDTLDNQIDNAQTTLDRAEKNLEKAEKSYAEAGDNLADAKEDYEKAKEEYGSPDFEAAETGIIKTLYVKEGDTIQKGAQIAEIYNNDTMLLTIPFSASDADSSLVGRTAKVVIEASDETLKGTVTKISGINEVLSGNRVVKQVTIQVENPGGISTSTTATASVGDIYSSEEGTFSVLTDTVVTANIAGEIGKLKAEEGDKVEAGDVIYTLTEESIEEQLDSYSSKVKSAEDAVSSAKDNVEAAQESIEDAKSDMQDIIDTRTDYSITAPISGKIISKDALVGDTISAQAATALCTIYDLSAVTFEMYVDELDVMDVEVGQEVDVTADAFEDEEIGGTVTNISLQSTANQGVTQYPVTVKIDDVGNLLPGMNVTGEIIVEKAENVLAIPADALMRGDVVYVKDDTVTEAVGDVPAGFREVAVETGITDGDYIEIKSGLNGDEEVYVERISEDVSGFMPGGSFGIIGGTNGSGQGERSRSFGGENGQGMPGGQSMPGQSR